MDRSGHQKLISLNQKAWHFHTDHQILSGHYTRDRLTDGARCSDCARGDPPCRQVVREVDIQAGCAVAIGAHRRRPEHHILEVLAHAGLHEHLPLDISIGDVPSVATSRGGIPRAAASAGDFAVEIITLGDLSRDSIEGEVQRR